MRSSAAIGRGIGLVERELEDRRVIDGHGEHQPTPLRRRGRLFRPGRPRAARARATARAGDPAIPRRQGDPGQRALGIERGHAQHLQRPASGLKPCRIKGMPRAPYLERREEAPEAGPGSDLRKKGGDRHGVPVGRRTMCTRGGADRHPATAPGINRSRPPFRSGPIGVRLPPRILHPTEDGMQGRMIVGLIAGLCRRVTAGGPGRGRRAPADSAGFVVMKNADTVAIERFERIDVTWKGTLALATKKDVADSWSIVTAPDGTVPLVEVMESQKPPDPRMKARVISRARIIVKGDSVSVDQMTPERPRHPALPVGGRRGAVPQPVVRHARGGTAAGAGRGAEGLARTRRSTSSTWAAGRRCVERWCRTRMARQC